LGKKLCKAKVPKKYLSKKRKKSYTSIDANTKQQKTSIQGWNCPAPLQNISIPYLKMSLYLVWHFNELMNNRFST